MHVIVIQSVGYLHFQHFCANNKFMLSADVTFMNTSEVPDWSFSVEVGPESSFSHRFEVSPAHSTGELTLNRL